MVKFDIAVFKFLTADHFRVLTAIEMGMKNHELVPTALLEAIAQMKRGNCYKLVTDLHKHKLVVHNSIPYDGYTLTFRGYDYLALNTFVKRGLIVAVGRQIGIGKESDVFEAFGPKDEVTDISPKYALKLHRLGRTSFRTVKNKRDYLKKNKYNTASKGNWLYVSRLSALKEFGFMKVLHSKEFPVPQPVDVCRHAILMSFLNGFPLYHAKRIRKPAILCNKALTLITKMAHYGLIHCDFNEFNLMVNDDYDLFLIDFPQMISISHQQGIEYFDRDVKCIVNYFKTKHDFEVPPNEVPVLDDTFIKTQVLDHLDNVIEASGYYGKNEQLHEHDFNTLHAFFSSTIKVESDNTVDNEDGDGDGDENENENGEIESEDSDAENTDDDEKEEWRLKKLRKKEEFQKKQKLKKAIKEHKENALRDLEENNTDDNNSKDMEHGDEEQPGVAHTISDAEIRRRLKKKEKQEIRKTRYKKAKKINDNNKARRQLKADLSNDFW
eukprot:CAMPEP_0202693628 /NCGR_PEP_ID=MMETSP1385-20130828/7682_1 /ASSEMBLY_ACC=CAM_ASM_000861 /TAXON_ID=933848 /ORGANISM="Elphidium margaritaceum" /LENGTH=495 /DNA_ID=CAMNT_0049349325 /DNA_START=38 /DNA_END=1525 /DNA_ORIENTATION=+